MDFGGLRAGCGFLQQQGTAGGACGTGSKKERPLYLPATVAAFLPGESLEFDYTSSDPLAAQPAGEQLHVRVTSEDGGVHYDQTVPAEHVLTLPESAAEGKGLHSVEATLLRDGKPLRTYRSGFWMRDWQYLLSGPKLTVGTDYFELNGKPLPVVGTTYMSGRCVAALPDAAERVCVGPRHGADSWGGAQHDPHGICGQRGNTSWLPAGR